MEIASCLFRGKGSLLICARENLQNGTQRVLPPQKDGWRFVLSWINSHCISLAWTFSSVEQTQHRLCRRHRGPGCDRSHYLQLPQPAKPHRRHSGGRRIIVSDGNHQQGRKMALKETQVISAGKIGFEFVRNIALPPLTSGDREWGGDEESHRKYLPEPRPEISLLI